MFTFQDSSQNILGILRDTKSLFSVSFAKVWYLVGIFNLPLVILGCLVDVFNPDPSNPSMNGLLLLAVLFFITVVISIAGSLFVYNRMFAVGGGGDTSIKASMQRMFKKTIPVLINTILVILLVMLVCLPLLVVLVLAGYYLSSMYDFGFVVWISTISFVFLLALNFFWFCSLFILFENVGVFSAIKLSMVHVYGKYWRTFFSLGLLMAIYCSFTFALLSLDEFLLSTSMSLTTQIAVSSFVEIIIDIMFFTLASSMLLVTYNDLKIRRALKLKFIHDQIHTQTGSSFNSQSSI